MHEYIEMEDAGRLCATRRSSWFSVQLTQQEPNGFYQCSPARLPTSRAVHSTTHNASNVFHVNKADTAVELRTTLIMVGHGQESVVENNWNKLVSLDSEWAKRRVQTKKIEQSLVLARTMTTTLMMQSTTPCLVVVMFVSPLSMDNVPSSSSLSLSCIFRA